MNSRILSRALQSIALIGWGSVLVFFYTSNRILNYLAPDFRVAAFIGGLALIVLGLFCLLTARETADCGHDHGPDDDHDHEALDVHPIVAFLILLVPLFLSAAWTQDKYSLKTLMRKGLNDAPSDAGSLFLSSVLPPLTREIIEKQHPPNQDGYRAFSLNDLFFSSADPEMRGLIEDMPVITQGRLVPDESGKPGRYRLYRLFITCCAADSRPIPIIADFPPDALPAIDKNEWVTLSGTINFPDEGKGPQPVLKVDFAEVTPAPMEESFMRGF